LFYYNVNLYKRLGPKFKKKVKIAILKLKMGYTGQTVNDFFETWREELGYKEIKMMG
jgi:hypothetical protein